MRILLILALLGASTAHAAGDTFTVKDKTFHDKGMAIRYVTSNHLVNVEIIQHSCKILTQSLKLKACPKNKLGNVLNAPYDPSAKIEDEAGQ